MKMMLKLISLSLVSCCLVLATEVLLSSLDSPQPGHDHDDDDDEVDDEVDDDDEV